MIYIYKKGVILIQFDEKKIKKQIELEEEGITLGIKRYRDKVQSNPLSELPPGIALTKRAIEPLADAIRRFKLPSPGGGRLVHTRKFLMNFDDDELAFMTIKKVLNAIAEGEPLQRSAISLAGMIKDQLEYKKFKEKAPNYLYKLEGNLKASKNQEYKRTVIMYAKRKMGIEDEQWTSQDKLHIGVKLIDLCIESTGLAEKVRKSKKPSQVMKKGKDLYILQPTPEAEKWIEEAHSKCEVLSPIHLPMIIPPVKWESPFGGGYLNNSGTFQYKIVKTRNKETVLSLADHDMPKVYRAVNALQETSWRINTYILEVLKQAWAIGSGMAGLPLREMPPLPATPWDSDEEFQRMKKETPEIVVDWKRQANKIYDKKCREESKRIAIMQKIWIAEKFKDEDEIYFIWVLDWRGRMYPLQSYINPQADDSGKALIEFTKGKPLGKRGAYWLAIHVANEYGYDKASFSDRVKWTKEHEALIRDSVDNPMDGERFWCEAAKPFQFLAACREWVGYLEEGESFVSHLPIALDGTCNGLQNFSALLRDEVGGKAVNLLPSDKPNDIYGEVAKVLNKMVEEDAKKGDENAKIWLGKIDRGIAKRAVMTTPLIP